MSKHTPAPQTTTFTLLWCHSLVLLLSFSQQNTVILKHNYNGFSSWMLYMLFIFSFRHSCSCRGGSGLICAGFVMTRFHTVVQWSNSSHTHAWRYVTSAWTPSSIYSYCTCTLNGSVLIKSCTNGRVWVCCSRYLMRLLCGSHVSVLTSFLMRLILDIGMERGSSSLTHGSAAAERSAAFDHDFRHLKVSLSTSYLSGLWRNFSSMILHRIFLVHWHYLLCKALNK